MGPNFTGFINGSLYVQNTTTSRDNLGLGTIAVQNADNVIIDGGTIDDSDIGGITPATGIFTSLTANIGLTLNNATTSYTPSDLNYYEEYSGSVTSSTSLSDSPGNIIFKITRIGRVVTITFQGWGNFQTSSDSEITFDAGSIPERFAPTAGEVNYQPIYNNNIAIVSGLVRINTNGSFIIYSSANLGTFSSLTPYYQYGSSATWIV